MQEKQSEKIQLFQKAMVDYFASQGRHDLPWRLTSDPWKLLMAELLLRKTTSVQAAAVFEVLKYRTPHDILEMDLGYLENVLKPIGLFKVRAAGLKTAAKEYESVAPENLLLDTFWRSLPGVGRYISNMVRCSAFGHAAPALDTNMIRVVQRVFGWMSSRKRPREDSKLWAFAETLVPGDNCREFNWGILDFGAVVCTARKPKCSECPISAICDFYSGQISNQLELNSPPDG
jgi:A/G-specific adenine glycosylase